MKIEGRMRCEDVPAVDGYNVSVCMCMFVCLMFHTLKKNRCGMGIIYMFADCVVVVVLLDLGVDVLVLGRADLLLLHISGSLGSLAASLIVGGSVVERLHLHRIARICFGVNDCLARGKAIVTLCAKIFRVNFELVKSAFLCQNQFHSH